MARFLLAGVLGTLSGGPIADRFGRRIVLVTSTALAAVMTAVLVALTHNGNLLLAIPLLLVTGFVFVASQSAFVVLGQEYLPNRMGLASGVTLGLAVSLGGTFSPVMGAIADAHGVSATILAAGALSIAGALIAMTLPGERGAPAPSAAQIPVDVGLSPDRDNRAAPRRRRSARRRPPTG